MAAEDTNSTAAASTGNTTAASTAAASTTTSAAPQHDGRRSGQHNQQGRHRGHGSANLHKQGKDGYGKKKNKNDEYRWDNRPTKRRRFGGGDRNAERSGGGGGGGEGDGEGGGRGAGGRTSTPDGERPSSNMSIPFSAEEIAAEARRPKRKVAVLIGYAGTGYRGMQINHDEKTIEGDLFAAFVAAGAIAKTNADDPKKSSLVRCARTDKGVHAAGNVISLKLIVEESDVVERINAQLPPQIRVWGVQRTVNSFSCYQACDSRWYEYLLPSYALLPPHPDSFLGREMVASARRADEEAAAAAVAQGEKKAEGGGSVYEDMMRHLDDVKDFWADVERDVVKPILDALDPQVRQSVVEQLHSADDSKIVGRRDLDDLEKVPGETEEQGATKTETTEEKGNKQEAPAEEGAGVEEPTEIQAESTTATAAAVPSRKLAVEKALRDIKTAYMAAKRRYRVTPERLRRLQDALSCFEGTRNFHNYTVQKSFHDASAKRHIKSFVVNPEPIQIRDTQWLSLRVHGQSFMMHQIRKMVAMAVMVARCGTAPGPALELSYGPRRISIPRAPGFGLLLERPVFDTYNARAQSNFQKEPLDFDKYEKEIRAFKDREIYARIWDVEENQNVFHAFFHQLDNYRTSYYLWAIPGGFKAAFERFGREGREPLALIDDPDEDAENPDEGDG